MSKQQFLKSSKEGYSKLLSVAICNSHKCSLVPKKIMPLMQLTAQLLVTRDNLVERIESKKDVSLKTFELCDEIDESIVFNCSAMGIVDYQLYF